jgi:outer membrane protein assembly factor BamB
VRLDATVDSSPIYLRSVRVSGRSHDVFFVTTAYGRTYAIDAASGRVLWLFSPSGYRSWAGTYRITNSTPVADPNRRYVYAASPDGRIHKLAVASGREAKGWPVRITRLPAREKIGPALNYSRGLVLAATGGYVGDTPPYQGHAVAISAKTGRIVHIWNALCSDQSGLIDPPSCSESGSAIWARSGVVVEPGSGKLLVATGNGRFDGHHYWGDSVLELSANAGRLLQNWTPADYAQLQQGDVDLGSTAPALLGSGLTVQGGKDGKLRLLSLGELNGKGGAGPTTGGELQTIQSGALFSAPAVWHHAGQTWLFVATFSDTTAFRLEAGKLKQVWHVGAGARSPVVAGGLLYLYTGNGLAVLDPESGSLVARLDAGDGHWNSPIVTDGRIALPEGNANDQQQTGVLDIWRLR